MLREGFRVWTGREIELVGLVGRFSCSVEGGVVGKSKEGGRRKRTRFLASVSRYFTWCDVRLVAKGE